MSGTEATTSAYTTGHPVGQPTAPPVGQPTAPPVGQPRRATRSPERGYLGGVASGLATHLGVDAFVVRALFLLTSVFGFGVLFYAGLWLTLPMEARDDSS